MSLFSFYELEYPLLQENEEKLKHFLFKAYNERAEFKYPERWKWIYHQPGAKSYFALHRNNIIGHVGVMPFTAANDSTPVNGAWSVDTFVLKPYRGKGIGKQLQLMAQRSNSVFQSVWMSNLNKQIKYQNGGIDNSFLVVLQTSNVSDVNCDYCVTSPEASKIAQFAEKHLQSFKYYVIRTEKYCFWRFEQQPFAKYLQITTKFGVAMIRKCGYLRPHVGMIGDVFTENNNPESLLEQIGAAANELIKQGCNLVRFATTDQNLINVLKNSKWDILSELPLIVQTTQKSLRLSSNTFVSLSDQDMDQFPW